MKRSRPPVDPARLKAQFPALTDEDVAAYLDVTKRVLADKDAAEDLPATLLARARALRASAEEARTDEDRRAVAYLAAVLKMQSSTVRRDTH
jgi:hypothetical protein